MAVDQVEDEEVLFRRIPQGRGLYEVLDDGSVEFTPLAFGDRNCRPSVDRAEKCSHNPVHTQNADTDGVVSVVASDVRSITVSREEKGTKTQFTTDVEHKPLPENVAHSEIFMLPECPNTSTFRKLSARLAYIASSRPWEILPLELRNFTPKV